MEKNYFKLPLLLALLLIGSIKTLAQDTQGFFLNDTQFKSAVKPPFVEYTKPTTATTVTVNINFAETTAQISKYIFGNNANVYMTQMVDQPVLIDHIKTLSPNVIRFPGGNLSSVYFWNASKKEDLAADVPERILDSNGATGDAYPYWYGDNAGNWTLSVDNYYQMLTQTNSTGIITLNYGYARYSTAANPVAAAAHLAADWVRYDNGRTKFWEIGNESNGTWQAGYRINTTANQDNQPQLITGPLYGKHAKVFIDSMRKAANEIGATIYIGAQLLQEAPASWWNATDKSWNAGVFQEAGNLPDFYIIHSYYTPYNENSTADKILSTATAVTSSMADYVKKAITDAGVAVKPIALTEWNIFAINSKQQVSYINGMHAAIVLGELMKNKYGMASRWNLANAWEGGNDHGMFSKGDEAGIPLWNPRPVYYYMYYFQKYTGDYLVSSSMSGLGSTTILTYASKFNSGEAGVVVINKGTTEQTVDLNFNDFGYGDRFYLYTLTGGTDNGEFSLKVFVNGNGPTLSSGGPSDVQSIEANSALIGGGVKFKAPGRSVNYMVVENGDKMITRVEAELASDVRVYPNPSKNNFTVDLPGIGFSRMEIVNAMGEKMGGEYVVSNQTSIEVRTSLNPGIYFLRLLKGTNVIVKKIVIE